MKKIILLFAITLVLFGCSKDDESSSSSNYYVEVNLLEETYRYEGIGIYSYGTNDCNSNETLRLQSIAQFEKSNFFLDLYIIHDEIQSDFQGYNITNSTIKSDGFNPFDCYDNFNFIAEFEFEGNYLELDSSINNYNKIKSVDVFDESSQIITYSVEGNFEATYKKIDNTTIKVTGSYRTQIEVLK